MKPVELFHVGPQKSGTTWVYRCLLEHPDVACPPRDSVHFFDMFWARGRDWYASHWRTAAPEQKLFDPTPSYLRSPWVAERIAEENPAARIALCLRDPIERAFSHYWHEKKKRHFDFAFDEVLVNYDLFASWVETGFYARHIERLLAHFPREQLLAQRFDHLQANPESFLAELLDFFSLAKHQPSVLARRVNVAGPRADPLSRGLHLAGRVLERAGLPIRPIPLLSGQAEYRAGIEPAVRAALLEIFEPETRRLERLLDLDLTVWRGSDPEGSGE